MRTLIAIIFLNLLFLETYAQNASGRSLKFCGLIGEGKSSSINIKIADLSQCDFKLLPIDSNIVVTEFTLTLVSKNNSSKLTEIKVDGNTIPINLREQILSNSKSFLIEQIQAKVLDKIILLKPFTVNLN